MKRIAIIPARGGSKRLPRKNIIPFMGRPIIAYTIEAALETGLFQRVVVSTEDEEIAGIARKHKADVDIRKPELATDKATVVQVCLDLLDREINAGQNYEAMCCLYPTAPLRNASDIIEVVNLIDDECRFAMAVTNYDLPPWQALKKSDTESLIPMWPDWVAKPSHEVPELLVDNGSTYAVNINTFLQRKSFYGDGLRGYFMQRSRSVDIDTAEDLDLALHYAAQAVSL